MEDKDKARRNAETALAMRKAKALMEKEREAGRARLEKRAAPTPCVCRRQPSRPAMHTPGSLSRDELLARLASWSEAAANPSDDSAPSAPCGSEPASATPRSASPARSSARDAGGPAGPSPPIEPTGSPCSRSSRRRCSAPRGARAA